MPKQTLVCPNCHFVGAARTHTPGSLGVEIFLWLFGLVTLLFVIGFFVLMGAAGYSIWRLAGRHSACPSCSHKSMVPTTSPVGRDILDALIARSASPGANLAPE
jgi:hypothetical protein